MSSSQISEKVMSTHADGTKGNEGGKHHQHSNTNDYFYSEEPKGVAIFFFLEISAECHFTERFKTFW